MAELEARRLLYILGVRERAPVADAEQYPLARVLGLLLHQIQRAEEWAIRVWRGGLAYQEEAHKASLQAVKEILTANLKLN